MIDVGKTLCLCTCDLELSSRFNVNIKNHPHTAKQFPISQHTIVDLAGNSTTPQNFLKTIKNAKPDLIVFYTHGDDTQIFGQDWSVVVEINTAHLLKGRITYAMACKTARKLGSTVIKAGGISYIGFNRCFKFIPYTNEVFGNCVNTIWLELLRGKTTGEAVEASKTRFDNYIDKYKQKYQSTTDLKLKQYFRKTVKFLLHDKNSLTLLGNIEATI